MIDAIFSRRLSATANIIHLWPVFNGSNFNMNRFSPAFVRLYHSPIGKESEVGLNRRQQSSVCTIVDRTAPQLPSFGVALCSKSDTKLRMCPGQTKKQREKMKPTAAETWLMMCFLELCATAPARVELRSVELSDQKSKSEKLVKIAR